MILSAQNSSCVNYSHSKTRFCCANATKLVLAIDQVKGACYNGAVQHCNSFRNGDMLLGRTTAFTI